jgi:molybdenum cofactor cytidylyltransferase/nicotine blue oxidoreductase
MGRPKALVRDLDGVAWVVRAARILRSGGCAETAVVVGAEAPVVTDLLAGEDVEIVEASEWATGVAASLRSGLAWAATTRSAAVLIHLVDLPDVGAPVVRRVLALADGNSSLTRASYGGRPGHPVLLGRDHWTAVASASSGDRGASTYLGKAGCALVECGDLASGVDQDFSDA